MKHCVEDDFEDDCVIFEGSPLYNSLVQTGSLAEELGIEIGTTKIISEDHHTNPTHTEVEPTPNSKFSWSSIFGMVCERCRMCFSKIKSCFVPDVQGVYVKYRKDMMHLIYKCSCVESDDRDYLQFYIQTQNVHSQHSQTEHIYNILHIIPCLAATSYNLLTYNSRPSQVWNTTSLLLWLLSSVVIVKFSISKIWKYLHTKKCRNEMAELETFLKQNEQFVSTVKKCLRLVQETELISRGFTLVSQRNPLSQLEGGQMSNTPRQCPVLRKLIFTDCRDGVLGFREFTKQLLEIHPLSSELDVYGSYLAFEPVQSYGPCLQINSLEKDKLKDITDGFAVAALKGMYHLFCLHQSEFIKTLVLVLQDNPSQGTELLQKEIKLLFSNITMKLTDWTVSLQKAYDFHSFDWMKKEPVQRERTVNTDQADILVAVHSLDLHLQAAITRVRAVSEIIEKSSENKQLPWKPEELVDKMQPIKAELESCKGCWDESLNRIEKVCGKFDEGSTPDDHVPAVAQDEGEEVEVRVKKVEDYIIEDQVFEAYTDSNEAQGDYDWDKPLTAEEKEKKRREKLEALRMLTELKSVISVRAVETERREKAAILKMHPELETNQLAELTPCDLTKDDVANVGSDKNDLTKDDVANDGSDKNDLTKDDVTNDESEKNDLSVNSNSVQLDEIEADIEKDKGLSKSVVNPFELPHRNKDNCSFISRQGVRRLRKSNMLDLSDSDLDDYPDDSGEEDKSVEDENDTRPRLGLPLPKKTEHFGSDPVDNDSDDDSVRDNFVQFRLPAVTLEERLEKLTGARFGVTADLALKAAARSREFGGMDEVTFGGDVYGELSDDNSDVDVSDTDVVNDVIDNVYSEDTQK